MRVCWAQGLMILVVVVLGISAMLSGCGAKGPLFLENPPQKSTKAVKDRATTDSNPDTQTTAAEPEEEKE